MHRRAFLAAFGGGGTALTAGCVRARVAASDGPATTATPAARLGDVVLPVPEDELVPAIHSVIPAIVEPAFDADWSAVSIEVGSYTYEPRLRDAEPVIGVERNGVSRAYPLGVLERHEVVNDGFPSTADGTEREPLLVTYCPSGGTSMTAIRRVRGTVALFEVSHFLWRSNLVLLDGATRSLWSQLLAAAIRGPATGESLTLVPSTLEPWGSWRAAHPDTEVLLRPPLSGALFPVGSADYEYRRFEASTSIIGEDGASATGRTLVIGVADGDEATAYPFGAVAAAGVVNDVVGDRPVVVAAALDGPFEGTRLRRANDVPPLFRFAWVDFHPETGVYGEGA